MSAVKTIRGIQMQAETLDRENAWLLFATFCGDVERTALALNLSPATILQVAEEEGWLLRLKPIIDLKKSARPGDIERALNRAVNYCQVHKFRLFVERVLQKLTQMDATEFETYLMTQKDPKTGMTAERLVTRPLADLATALEKCQAMSYQALGDTATDRAHRQEPMSEESAGEMMNAITAAMDKVRGSKTPRSMLLDAQLQNAAELAPVSLKPAKVVDDTHREEG